MKKIIVIALSAILALGALVGCSSESEQAETEDKGVIKFGVTNWTSTRSQQAIVTQILEEAGYTVETTVVEQPMIWLGLQNKEMDFFLDAWLPNTEKVLWEEYKDDLVKVSKVYEEAPIGWVVPSYVEEDSIEDLKQNADKYDNQVVTIAAGAGIVSVAEDVIEEYELDNFDLVTAGEASMLASAKAKIDNEEPIVFTGWRPHSMFAMFDLKFLEDPKGLYEYDDIYVLSYKGIEEEHPEAYEILSKWNIEVEDLEEMMLKYNEDDIPFEESAEEWIEENRDKVDEMLGK